MTPRHTRTGRDWSENPTDRASVARLSTLPMQRERAEPLWRTWAVCLIVGALVFVGAML